MPAAHAIPADQKHGYMSSRAGRGDDTRDTATRADHGGAGTLRYDRNHPGGTRRAANSPLASIVYIAQLATVTTDCDVTNCAPPLANWA